MKKFTALLLTAAILATMIVIPPFAVSAETPEPEPEYGAKNAGQIGGGVCSF